MKEHGILFTAPMVRAILAGTKTQTRRAVKVPKGHHIGALDSSNGGSIVVVRDDVPQRGRTMLAPHGPVGRRLWVKETWDFRHLGERIAGESCVRIAYSADGHQENAFPPNGWNPTIYSYPRWRSPLHMPRWASRVTLEVTRVRLERVQAITEEDARAEGVELETAGPVYRYADGRVDARSVYADLWDTISGAGSWASNPWCWVYDFKRIA